MKSLNSSERQSAPTGAQTSELKQEASRPLGVAACSDSSFFEFVEELCRAFNHLGAESDLIGTVASIGETLDVDTAITCLRDWNDHHDQTQTGQ